MNAPNGTLFLDAAGTKTEDTFTPHFLKRIYKVYFAIGAEYFCRVFQNI